MSLAGRYKVFSTLVADGRGFVLRISRREEVKFRLEKSN